MNPPSRKGSQLHHAFSTTWTRNYLIILNGSNEIFVHSTVIYSKKTISRHLTEMEILLGYNKPQKYAEGIWWIVNRTIQNLERKLSANINVYQLVYLLYDQSLSNNTQPVLVTFAKHSRIINNIIRILSNLEKCIS